MILERPVEATFGQLKQWTPFDGQVTWGQQMLLSVKLQIVSFLILL